MCIYTGQTVDDRSERERLEAALGRPSVREHEFCPDGKIIIEAARKHLATLPKPPRKVKVTRWMVAAPHFESVSYADREDAVARARNLHNGQVVELHGEYEMTEPA